MAGCFDAIREQNARILDLEMQANGGHLPLNTIYEDDGYYSASCRCGWERGGFPDKTSGDAAVREHIEAFWASVPDGQEVFASHCNVPANNDHPSSTCMYAVDRVCRECGAVRYVGPDCEHVAQPAPVDAEGRCLNCRDDSEGGPR